MAESLDAYYRRYGSQAAAGAADPAAIEALLAPSLDSSLFRQELAYLANLCDQSGSDSKRARDFESEARRWIAKLEADVSQLQEELRREFDERQRLARELAAAQAVAGVAARLPNFVKRILARLARARS
jgi:signal transduction histidine kinase